MDDAIDGLRGDGWKALLARITPTVMATTFPGALVGGYALTTDWPHVDLIFYARASLDASKLSGIRPLFDKSGVLLPPGAVPRPPMEGEPYFPVEAVDLYFYFLGNLITVLGRGELLLATNGCIARRDHCLVPLLLAERGIRRAGGQKRLDPFLSPEQRELLESLPPISASLDAVVACDMAIARIFVSRGRALAERTGARWPVELEAATIAHVEHGLGVRLALHP